MTESEINQKLEQTNTDKANIEANIAELEKQKTALQKKWLAAISGDTKLILNLSELSEYAKKTLKKALDRNYSWISFRKKGDCATYSAENDGLSFYSNTKIVFGETNG